MDAQRTSLLNELQEVLGAVRKDAEKTNLSEAVAQEIEDAVSLIEQSIEGNAKMKLLVPALIQDDAQGVARAMKENGIDVADSMGLLKVTVIHLAGYYNSRNTVRFLTEVPHCDINAKTKVGDIPLMFVLYSAQSDNDALSVLRVLLSAKKECDCSIQNNNYLFPLCVAIKRNLSKCAQLLSIPPMLAKYKPQDLLYAMKLALVNGQDDLVDTIFANMTKEMSKKILTEIKLLPSLRAAMVETLDFMGRCQPPIYKEQARAVDGVEVADEDLLGSYLPNACTAVAEDASGRRLKPGDIVKTLSYQIIKRALPPSVDDQTLARLSDSLVIIHDIPCTDKIYIELAGKSCIANINSFGVVFHRDGPSAKLLDGSVATVGSYAQVCSSAGRLKDLMGKDGWIHGMEETCGRTGKIIRIAKNLDVLVQFAWGVRFYFKPKVLLQSSPDAVEIQDTKTNKWITAGTLVHIGLFGVAFTDCQQKHRLPYEGDYANLPWKFAIVKRIYIKAFSTQKNIQISRNGQDYVVHADCIEMVNSVKDRTGAAAHVGDFVKIVEDKNTVKAAQKPEFGGWVETLNECISHVGKLLHIRPAVGETNGVVVKVEFEGSKTFYFNPRAIILAEAKDLEKPAAKEETAPEDTILMPDDMEKVNRDDLVTLQKLGEGGFGCVFKGTWKRNDEKKVVAIKQIKAGVTSSISFSQLMQEAKTQFSLSQHPNIVSLYGISYLRDLWMVLEYVDGYCLFDMLFPATGSRVELAFRRKVKLCLDMCNAIAYVHNKGYLHCDIKPHNMMVDKRTDRLYILDFGITRFLGNMNLMDFATQYTNSVSGTLYYIPPECLQPDSNGKYRRPKFSADIWALGAVFYELFAHSHLCANSMEFLHDKMMNVDTKIKKGLGKLPHPVVAIVGRCLDFDQTRRPTAQELAEFFHELKET